MVRALAAESQRRKYLWSLLAVGLVIGFALPGMQNLASDNAFGFRAEPTNRGARSVQGEQLRQCHDGDVLSVSSVHFGLAGASGGSALAQVAGSWACRHDPGMAAHQWPRRVVSRIYPVDATSFTASRLSVRTLMRWAVA